MPAANEDDAALGGSVMHNDTSNRTTDFKRADPGVGIDGIVGGRVVSRMIACLWSVDAEGGRPTQENMRTALCRSAVDKSGGNAARKA